MDRSDPVLLTSTYRLKTGSEKNFVKLWTELIGGLAYQMGADSASVYHNKDTDEYLASLHWSSEQSAQRFLRSSDFKEATLELNTNCFLPATKDPFEILYQKAA